MKSIIINLGYTSRGGGLQNAINFLLGVIKLNPDFLKNSIFLISNSKELKELCDKHNLYYLVVRKNVIEKLYFECFLFKQYKRSIIFTLFGIKPLMTYSNFNIVGCAYSNLFYKEINFWGYLPWLKKIIREVKDYFRLIQTKKADVLIFETELLSKRFLKQHRFNTNDVFVVKMAVNNIVKEFSEKIIKKNIQLPIDSSKFNILLLNGAHPNKRVHKLIEFARYFQDQLRNDICFVTTMEENSYAIKIFKEFKKYGLEQYLINLKPIPNNLCGEVISRCDAIMNIPILESFSNNWIEAWTMGKPLFVTDADWSRYNCGEAAIFLDMNDIENTSKDILRVIDSKMIQEKILKEAKLHLRKFPDYLTKTSLYLDIINKYR